MHGMVPRTLSVFYVSATLVGTLQCNALQSVICIKEFISGSSTSYRLDIGSQMKMFMFMLVAV